jgi:glycosyltransferase 2 family protein
VEPGDSRVATANLAVADDLETEDDPAIVAGDAAVEAIAQDRSWLAHRLRDPRTLLSFVLAVAIVLFLFPGLKIDPAQVWQTIQKAKLGYFLLGFAVYYAAFILRALRWQTLLANVGFSKAKHPEMPGLGGLIEIIYLSWFINCIVPAKLGDVYRGYLIKQAANVSFSRTVGTILAERIIDLFVLFSLLLVSGFLTLQGHVPDAINGVMIFGGVMVAGLVGGLIALRVLGDRVLRFVPHRFRDLFVSFQHGMLMSFRRRSLPLLVVFTAVIWLLEGLRLFWVVQALDQGHLVSLPVVIFIALASSLITTIPATPGGLGLVEGAVVTVLLLFLGNEPAAHNTAVSIALLDRLINYWSIVIGGLIVYLISRRK